MDLGEVVTRAYKKVDESLLKGADATVKAWNYITGKPKSSLANILLSASVAGYSVGASVAAHSSIPLSVSLPLIVSIPGLYLVDKAQRMNKECERRQHHSSTKYFCINPFSKSVSENYAKFFPFLIAPLVFFSFKELAEPVYNFGPKIAYGLADLATTSLIATSYIMRSKYNFTVEQNSGLQKDIKKEINEIKANIVLDTEKLTNSDKKPELVLETIKRF